MENTITVHDAKQRSPEWESLRIGKVGGSEAIGLTTPARLKSLILLKLSELQAGEQEEIFVSSSMQHGIDTEPLAIASYEADTMVDVRQVGYITNSKYKYAGLSPDGLIGDSGAIEVKCPAPKKHIANIVGGNISKEYLPQILWYFLILDDLEYVDFMSYCPKVKTRQVQIIEVRRDNFEKEIEQLEAAYFNFESKVDEYIELYF